MFKYDKKIDIWSKKMIKNLDKVWGNKIPKNKNNSKSLTSPFLIIYLNRYFNKYGKKIFARFNKLTSLSYKINDFDYYINNTPVSLHNSKKSYISISQYHSFNKYPAVIIHEISHIYFYNYINSKKFLKFNNISKTSDLISEKERNELKEIITVIINKEFANIIDRLDEGYPNHKNIREKIFNLWIKENINFDEWVAEVIKIYKKEVVN
ncbi:MAG: hypothetical protein WC793_02175 [Candidatus Paceibacterota bacterium]|jgi:hypothetical protein